ncbi:helix-turn-helix domain-containing protein [Paenarthrobacter ilicis]|uniref:helix-turn-helix domain-containing protein n=1 Tax=Paenarthrobacter ilicis TaxID=43665 RepID=UPI0028D0921A|nr:helix-turn-helix domain-containing protein [Paenarthrobacter ilicis]
MSSLLAQDKKTEVTTTEQQTAQAREVAALFRRDPNAEGSRVAVESKNGEALAVPPELSSLVRQVIEVISRGGTVTIGSLPKEVTTTTAAKMIGVSRPTLMQLINNGDLPAHKVGSHSRILTDDVQSYKARRDLERRQAFDDLRALEDELGVEE